MLGDREREGLGEEFLLEEFGPALEVGFAEFELDLAVEGYCDVGAGVDREGGLKLGRGAWEVDGDLLGEHLFVVTYYEEMPSIYPILYLSIIIPK